MEEQVGDPDSTHTDGEADEAAPSDYLESLRARFDELASRIEAATQESLERTQSILTEPEAAEPDADPTPAVAPATPAADVDELSTEDVAVTSEQQETATSDAAPDAGSDPAPEEMSESRFHAPPPSVDRQPQPTTEAPVQPAAPEPEAPHMPEKDSPTAEDTAAVGSVADDADLDAWDETAPPAEPVRAPRSSPTPSATAGRDLSDPQTLGAQLRSRMRPVADPHPRRKIMVRVLIVVVLLAIATGVAWWFQGSGDDAAPDEAPTEQTPPTTAASDAGPLPTDNQPADTQAAATQALIDSAISDVTVTIDEGTAVLTGSVDSEEARATAADAVASVPRVSAVDNRLVVEPPPPFDPAEIPAAAEQARDDTGFGHLGVTVIDGTATITGVVPIEDLDGGYFAYTAPLREALLAINGINAVRTRLQLSGEAANLSRDLDALLEATPIVFAAGNTALTPEDELVLDQAAAIIADNPGLRVIVTGHPDPAGDAAINETLALERASAVVLYLVGDGIPATRLIAASGPETGVRVVMEVAP